MKNMMPSAPDTMHRYTGTAVLTHWLTAATLAVMLALGWTMTALEDNPASDVWFGWHRSLGAVLAMLIVLRLLWRLGHPPADPYRLSPPLERMAATAMHRVLYLMMFVMPITGLVGSWLSEDGLGAFGRVAPQPLGVHKLLSETFFNLHALSAYILTRSFGASCGDLLSQPVADGGLGLGTINTSAVFVTAILFLVSYLAIQARKAQKICQ